MPSRILSFSFASSSIPMADVLAPQAELGRLLQRQHHHQNALLSEINELGPGTPLLTEDVGEDVHMAFRLFVERQLGELLAISLLPRRRFSSHLRRGVGSSPSAELKLYTRRACPGEAVETMVQGGRRLGGCWAGARLSSYSAQLLASVDIYVDQLLVHLPSGTISASSACRGALF